MNHEELRSISRSEVDYKEKVIAGVDSLKHYVNTYTPDTCFNNGNVFVDDILYGLGVAIDAEKYSFANGYSEFKKLLVNKLVSNERINFKGEV